MNDTFGLLKLNWSYQTGRIHVNFYGLDESGNSSLMDGPIQYDCHT